jgi:hypothetical protein
VNSIVEHPIVHFLAAGLVLFVLFGGGKDRGAERSLITVNRDVLLNQIQFRANVFDREMAERELASQSEVELRRMIDDYVREEALYHEAEVLGLAEDDELIRGRLVQKLEFILEGFASASVDPNSDDVAEYFEAHRPDYAMGPYLTFAHVFFGKANRSRDEALATAQAKLGELNRKAVRFDEAGQHGETFHYHTKYFGKTPGHIASEFGCRSSKRYPSRDVSLAACGNILESRWRFCDGVEHSHGLSSGWWSAHATGLSSVCLHSCPTSLKPGGLEAVPNAIALIKADLVGCLSDKSVMGHLGVVPFDVEIDHLLELHEAVERMQVQPLMT